MTTNDFERIILLKSYAAIEKQFKDKSMSHNLIYGNVAYDVVSRKQLEHEVTSQGRFRKELYHELSEISLQKFYDFQGRVLHIEEGKKKLRMRKKRFDDRVKQSIPFIDENNYRYQKTLEFIKDDHRSTKFKTAELQDINSEIDILTRKKDFFLLANKQLKNYENYLLEVLSILPADYVKGLKENNMNALLRRCDTLFYMNRVIYGDLNRTAATIRLLMIELDTWYSKFSNLQSHQSIIFPKLNNKLFLLQDEFSSKYTNYSDYYISLRKRCHTLGVLILSVNNITNKAYQIIEKGYFCQLELNLIPKIMNFDPDTKFMRIEEFISCALQILELLESKQAASS